MERMLKYKVLTEVQFTDIDGNFSLDISPKEVLIISFNRISGEEITIDNQTHINVTLEEDSKLLDEVIVIGYGTNFYTQNGVCRNSRERGKVAGSSLQ